MQETLIEVTGTKFRLMEAGEGAPVVFLHDAAGAAWSPLLEELSARWRVLAPEHPGFGRMPIPEWMMSVGDLAFFYLDVLKAMTLHKVHLIGHGIGGWIAAEMAMRATDRLATLTLMAPAGIEAADAPFDDIFVWSAEEFARRHFHDQQLADAWRQEQAKLDIDIVLQNRTALARLAWNPRLHNPQLAHWLHRIDIPTLLVWGEDDQVIPFACHRRFKNEIRQAELITLPRAGHALTIERARDVGRHLKTFFQGATG